MTGRNNRPDNEGPAASPARLDQFGDKQAKIAKEELKRKFDKNDACR